MNFVCCILARKNSVRVKNKNILNFRKKPLIWWTLKQSVRIKIFDRIILSTDSKRIKKICKSVSKKIIINNRPKKLAGNYVKSETVIKYLIKKYHLKNSDYIILLQPTSPLRSDKDINKMIRIVKKNKINSLHSANEYIGKKIINKPFNLYNHKRKIIGPSYNGSIYIVKITFFMKNKLIYEKKPNLYITPKKYSLDIDYEKDFK